MPPNPPSGVASARQGGTIISSWLRHCSYILFVHVLFLNRLLSWFYFTVILLSNIIMTIIGANLRRFSGV